MRDVRKVILISCVGLSLVGLAGCLSWRQSAKETVRSGRSPAAAVESAYSGPRARIVLADFEVKAAKATSEAGSSLRQMLAEILSKSNRFTLVERGEIEQPQVPVQAEGVVPAQGLVIFAAVTKFEPQVSGGRAGIGGGGGVSSGALGGLLGSNSNKAHMALEVRIADAATSKVLATTVIQGQAADLPVVSWDEGKLGKGLSAYARTPMEKAIHTCVAEAAKYIAGAVPADYYKIEGGKNGKT